MLEDRPSSENAHHVAPGKSEDPVSLEPASSSARPDSKPLSAALERIGANTPASARYRLEGEIARGGMGIIQKVWDGNLRRAVARKILGKTQAGSDPRKSDPRSVGRFLEEAQVTAQLEHPGIVPVHELGLDAEGKLYFTMRLVRGEDLHNIFEHVKTGAHGWNLTRALHVMLRVCEAMSYAHKKGVLHRDLKPANVMVGRFGEVYVMDWGLARVLGEHDTKDVRIAPDPQSSDVRTDRGSIDVGTPDSPLLTMDGDVVGTPAYMSPEQARGEVEALGPASDVYSLGAMLYHLLAGTMPYVEPGTKPSARAIWYRLMEQPPMPLARLAPNLPPELLAIVDKAMAREVRQRYESTGGLAEDLRAFLEQRVVRAYRTGALVELQKWSLRNRVAAGATAALVLLAGTAGFLLAWIESSKRKLAQQQHIEESIVALQSRVEELWPLDKSTIPALQSWIEEATELGAFLPALEEELAAFERSHESPRERRADPHSGRAMEDDHLRFLESTLAIYRSFADIRTGNEPTTFAPEFVANHLEFLAENLVVLESEIPRLESRIGQLKQEISARCQWRYLDESVQMRHSKLHASATGLRRLARDGGLISRMHSRLSAATEVASILEDSAGEWSSAAAIVSDPEVSTAYQGLELAPQEGLVPLGHDLSTGLFEFWHAASGARPARQDGSWQMSPETGIVFVLVPAGTVCIGFQQGDPAGPNYLPANIHLPKHQDWIVRVDVGAFLLSKYELTQGQWERLGGRAESNYHAGFVNAGMPRMSASHPADSMTWVEADEVLKKNGLRLPTEAEWERAARARTQTLFDCGDSEECLAMQANLLDQTAVRVGWPASEPPAFDDGFALTSPVDALASNTWGFHSMFGNVEEWCQDWYATKCEEGQIVGPSGEHVPPTSSEKLCLGGSFRSEISGMRVSARQRDNPSSIAIDRGIRACRSLSIQNQKQ